jgi:cellobiose phosphorylase
MEQWSVYLTKGKDNRVYLARARKPHCTSVTGPRIPQRVRDVLGVTVEEGYLNVTSLTPEQWEQAGERINPQTVRGLVVLPKED